MKLKDLALNPKNPRTISPEKLTMLKKSLEEFGDLSGIVYNRKTKQIVGGHQRTKAIDPSATVEVTKTFKLPTRTGTVAEGYVIAKNGERFIYREVSWDKTKEKAANIAANKGAGEWDMSELSNWMKELDDFGFDLDLTMFDESERNPYLNMMKAGEVKNSGKELSEDSFDNFQHECPKCGFEWNDNESA